RHDHGTAPSPVAGARRAVPSGVGADRRREIDSAELPERVRIVFQDLIDKLTRHEDLTEIEASAAMHEIMAGRAAPSHVAVLLIGLAMKGERPIEIVGLARAMRANAVPLSKPYADLFDTCGTGGDRSGTFNISSCAAVVVASCGVRVAK